jgi:hypothetical protein
MNRQQSVFLALLLFSGASQSAAIEGLLAGYAKLGAGPFSAAAGEALWAKPVAAEGGEPRACATCHGKDLTRPGLQQNTGKVIEPMAPSVNPQRLTDAEKIEKWFKRNCKWTLGRECSPQEKGDVLSFIQSR